MIQAVMPPFVYDAAALMAADRGDRRMLGLHSRALLKKRRILVPAPVLAQAWRNNAGKQSRLSWLLKACVIDPTTEQTAKAAGLLLGDSRTSDVVDAIVVATALPLNAHVVTSDVDDLTKLAGSANAALTLIPV